MTAVSSAPGVAAGTGTAEAPPSRRGRRRWLGENPLGLLFSAPYIVFVLVVFAYPIVFVVWMSFQDYFFAAPGAVVDRPFVGFDNYAAVLQDPKVWQSFGNVGIFLLINVPLTVVLSLLLAYGLNTIVHAGIFFRVSYFVPYVTASVAVVAVWLFLFSQNGLVNQILGPLAPDPSWLVSSTLAMPTIALFVTWKGMAFYILLYLAALQNVSKELYEAAAVDGAGRIRKFFSVTVPGVRPATFLVLLLATITGANLFTEPYLLTNGGGPNGASASPVLLMYQKGIEQGNPDVAAAIGVILIAMVLVIAWIQRRFVGKED
ncbi:multiple sugar transport system permease protein [Agromyces flavus]|uniref:Carbohydrate ABC transporter membrane protein 1, CUT1 family n=1 Tax=Agromyces flavus TaxID=589382 RepID=A0A1H1SNB1_9MICO|nr:sugar ABC transporter permease [Agromyces flavus]MCP2369053.1 multiple sugar transport system permease protein [Agromyces flavus]GGI48508.1 ABC transporter permease [Agromyces flavus]SDS49343.1 carbohydrate ABC transporter membrane protein 1, CUT1 family [Agromyces flavus]